jgi:chromosome condensin MukBEF ATPase and DNA-binding subunit MukB
MPRRKRTSQTLTNAQLRITALNAIDPSLDLGNGISIAAFNAKIEETRQMLDTYNNALSSIDQTSTTMQDLEKSLTELSTRLLSGIATVYGRSSSEYKMVNSTRRTRRRPATVPGSAIAAEAV